MKPTAVQYPHSFSLAVSELGRTSGRFGVTAYALSLVVALLTFLGSVFFKEITHTFGHEVVGFRASTLWETGLLVTTLVWLVAVTLGLLCLGQKGRPRSYGVSSLGINLAAAMLVACTLL